MTCHKKKCNHSSNYSRSRSRDIERRNDSSALEEEVQYLREIIKQGKLRETNEGAAIATSSSKKMGKGKLLRISEETLQDSCVVNHNNTGPFKLIIPENLLYKKQSTSISPSQERQSTSTSLSQEKQSTSTSPSQERQSTSTSPLQQKQSTSTSPSQQRQSTSTSPSQERQSISTSPSQERQSTSTLPSQERQSTFTSPSQQRQSTSLSSRPPVRIPKLHLSLPSGFYSSSKKMSQKKHNHGESEQEYSDFEQDSGQSSDSEQECSYSESSSDSEQRSRSKSDQRSKSQRSSKSRPKSDQRTSKFKRKSKSNRSSSKQRSKSRRRSSSIYQQLHQRTQKYLNVEDLPKTFKEALRRELFWVIERIPAKSKLDLNSTFNSQHNLVTGTIIPTVMKVLDLDAFLVTEAVIYDMIHARHKHQREEHLTRKKHLNSRRNDKRLMRARMIENLQAINDPLIKKFKKNELQQIKEISAFYSPEVSETDTENLNGKHNIVVKKLKWHSLTLKLFLRNYIDQLFTETSKVPKKRIRVYDDNFYEKEQTAPFHSPKWAVGDYQGFLKDEVERACYRRKSDALS
ncbi:17927_t:CDS:2 [Rhizophagus irregularis]|nr:17927_t:CDS:2 [Rhizophagus irregularis]